MATPAPITQRHCWRMAEYLPREAEFPRSGAWLVQDSTTRLPDFGLPPGASIRPATLTPLLYYLTAKCLSQAVRSGGPATRSPLRSCTTQTPACGPTPARPTRSVMRTPLHCSATVRCWSQEESI